MNLRELHTLQTQSFKKKYVWRIGKHPPISSLCIRWRWSISSWSSLYSNTVLAWKQIWRQRNSGLKIKIFVCHTVSSLKAWQT